MEGPHWCVLHSGTVPPYNQPLDFNNHVTGSFDKTRAAQVKIYVGKVIYVPQKAENSILKSEQD